VAEDREFSKEKFAMEDTVSDELDSSVKNNPLWGIVFATGHEFAMEGNFTTKGILAKRGEGTKTCKFAYDVKFAKGQSCQERQLCWGRRLHQWGKFAKDRNTRYHQKNKVFRQQSTDSDIQGNIPSCKVPLEIIKSIKSLGGSGNIG
jgi:hypothetical protein